MEFDIFINITWGLLVMSYYYLKGIAAGIFFIIAFGEVMNIAKLKKMTKLGLWMSFTFSIVLPMILVADLQQPGRFIELMFRPHIASPMAWGGYILIIYFLAGGLTTHFYMRDEFIKLAKKHEGSYLSFFFKLFALFRMDDSEESIAKDKSIARGFFYFNMIIAFVLEMYGGILMSVNASRPIWGSPLTPMFFIVSSLSGGAMVLLMVYGLFNVAAKTPNNIYASEVTILAKIAIFALLTELLFFFMQIFYFLNSTSRAKFQFIFLFNNGFETTQYLFIDLGLAIVLPLLLILFGFWKENYWVSFVGGLFTVLGSWIYKYNLIIGGQEIARASGNQSVFEWTGHEIQILVSITLLFIAVLLAVFWFLPWHIETNTKEVTA